MDIPLCSSKNIICYQVAITKFKDKDILQTYLAQSHPKTHFMDQEDLLVLSTKMLLFHLFHLIVRNIYSQQNSSHHSLGHLQSVSLVNMLQLRVFFLVLEFRSVLS